MPLLPRWVLFRVSPKGLVEVAMDPTIHFTTASVLERVQILSHNARPWDGVETLVLGHLVPWM